MTAVMTDITAGKVRELPGHREDSVTGASNYASEPAGSRTQWWAGIPGLDPWLPVQDPEIAAKSAAMGCAAHVLGDLFATDTWSRRDITAYVKDWHKWLGGTQDTVNAWLRRNALRFASSIRLHPEMVLPFAQAIYDGCGGR